MFACRCVALVRCTRKSIREKRLTSRPLPAIQFSSVDGGRYETVPNEEDDDVHKKISEDDFPATSQEEAYTFDDDKEPLYELPQYKQS